MLERFQTEVSCSLLWGDLPVTGCRATPAGSLLDCLPVPPHYALCMQHPGFDFSGATFNGEAPNPRSFMGGMKST